MTLLRPLLKRAASSLRLADTRQSPGIGVAFSKTCSAVASSIPPGCLQRLPMAVLLARIAVRGQDLTPLPAVEAMAPAHAERICPFGVRAVLASRLNAGEHRTGCGTSPWRTPGLLSPVHAPR